MSAKLDAVEAVDIDVAGRFKYILIEVKDGAHTKNIVRGYHWAGYHADILDKVEQQLMAKDLLCDCPGGGRIEHEPDAKKLKVYGYSMGFGRADHQISVDILKTKYPDYEITWSNDGY